MTQNETKHGSLRTTIRTRSGEEFELLTADEGVSVEAWINGAKIGGIEFNLIDDGLHPSKDFLKLCLMDVEDKFRRQGLGEAMIKLAKSASGLDVVASCPLNPEEQSDGSHLVGDGPAFVTTMRERGVIADGCCGPCHCGGDDEYSPDWEEEG